MPFHKKSGTSKIRYEEQSLEEFYMEILTIILIVLLIYAVFKVAYVALKILAILLIIFLIVEFGSKLLGG